LLLSTGAQTNPSIPHAAIPPPLSIRPNKYRGISTQIERKREQPLYNTMLTFYLAFARSDFLIIEISHISMDFATTGYQIGEGFIIQQKIDNSGWVTVATSPPAEVFGNSTTPFSTNFNQFQASLGTSNSLYADESNENIGCLFDTHPYFL